jgi:glycosyltransferase involved in cell wall biosynthesis
MYYKTEEEIMQNWKGDKAQPVVSICCITYNHQDYIAQAIDGFLMQETDFPFEILIHDDASTDGTIKIIKNYENKYPNIVRTIIQEKNQFSQGVRFINAKFLFPLAKGKYIALCEGDDYWTSPQKISKQFKFMEENLNYSCCFHAVEQKDDTINKSLSITKLPLKGNIFYFEDVVKSYFIPTLSLFFRKSLMPLDLPSYQKKMYGDMFMQLLLTSNGPAYYFDEVMGVYRHHDNGVSKSLDHLSSMENALNVYNEINLITKGRFERLINNRMSSYADYCYFRHFSTQGGIFKSCYYFMKIILKHPLIFLSKLKDKVLIRKKLLK